MTVSIKTSFAVPLHCDSCISDVTSALKEVKGIETVDCDLASQMVTIEGSVPPSIIVQKIQETGRDAVVRGSGEPNSSAVCILESHDPAHESAPVRGLARIVKVSPGSTLVDLTLSGLIPCKKYLASIRTAGDVSKGATTTGQMYKPITDISTDEHGKGQTYVVKEDLPIWELIGRSLVVGTDLDGKKMNIDDAVGVIARSAGVWENQKTVCSCSGKTIWEERKEAKSKGIN
ncbi:superoxide dismutase [Dipodascopsis uninucleata]